MMAINDKQTNDDMLDIAKITWCIKINNKYIREYSTLVVGIHVALRTIFSDSFRT